MWMITDWCSDTGETVKVYVDLIVGADGAHSAVRNQLQRHVKYVFQYDMREDVLTVPHQNVLRADLHQHHVVRIHDPPASNNRRLSALP